MQFGGNEAREPVIAGKEVILGQKQRSCWTFGCPPEFKGGVVAGKAGAEGLLVLLPVEKIREYGADCPLDPQKSRAGS